MFDPGAWLAGLSTPVTVGWGVWLVWSLALVGWYRYALVAPKAAVRVAAPRPPAMPVRSVAPDTDSFVDAAPFNDELPSASADLEIPAPQIDWSTAETAPAMHAPRRRPDAAAAAEEAATQPAVPASSYQFTTHRQDEVGVSQH